MVTDSENYVVVYVPYRKAVKAEEREAEIVINSVFFHLENRRNGCRRADRG